jgi:nicotinate-nucleotide pyrophosphorylase (carboxylating)
MISKEDVLSLIRAALVEDLGNRGDVTTEATVPPEVRGRAEIIAKQDGILAGLPVAGWTFAELDPELVFTPRRRDGDRVQPGEVVAEVSGRLRSILIAERTALNFLMRLSGIATLTSRFVEAVAGTRAKILDTRKTTPGWRRLEKYAVQCGGGKNHRMGLYDQVLIKENHIAAAGSVAEAIRRAKSYLREKNLPLFIEVEVSDMRQLREALEEGVDRILLDNMSSELLREAVRLGAGEVEFEASGNVTLANVREVAETGVDYVSIGALTHSAPAFDFSLLVKATW